MTCPDCKGTGTIIAISFSPQGEKEPFPMICECNESDRKDFIHDVCEAAPKSGHCSKEGVVSPE